MKKEKRIRQFRRAMSVLGPRSTVKCCFVHVPKCGGNSIGNALVNLTPLTAKNAWVQVVHTRMAAAIHGEGLDHVNDYHGDGLHCEATMRLRRDVMTYHFALGAPVICGHFLFDERVHAAYRDEYRFITMVREPVARMISHYTEEVSSGFLDMGFEEYLETPMARRHANMLTRYFANVADLQEPSAEAVSIAKENLAKFDVVGDLSRMEQFREAVSHALQARMTIHHERKASLSKPQIDEATRKRLEEMCAGDTQVYRHAVEHYVV